MLTGGALLTGFNVGLLVIGLGIVALVVFLLALIAFHR